MCLVKVRPQRDDEKLIGQSQRDILPCASSCDLSEDGDNDGGPIDKIRAFMAPLKPMGEPQHSHSCSPEARRAARRGAAGALLLQRGVTPRTALRRCTVQPPLRRPDPVLRSDLSDTPPFAEQAGRATPRCSAAQPAPYVPSPVRRSHASAAHDDDGTAGRQLGPPSAAVRRV